MSSFGYFKSIPHHNNNIDTNKNTRHRPQHKPRHTCSYQSSFFQNVIANSQHTSIFRALSPAHLPISDRPMPPHTHNNWVRKEKCSRRTNDGVFLLLSHNKIQSKETCVLARFMHQIDKAPPVFSHTMRCVV